MSSPLSPVRVLLVGGCGHWAASENHVPAILAAQRNGLAVRVVAICDRRDPYDPALLAHMPHLRTLMTQDRPAWIRPEPHEPRSELERRLQHAHREHHFDAIIVACDPVAHHPYLAWATSQGIHVLCDKPIICAEDAAWNPDRAAEIRTNFDALLRAHLNQPGHLFAVPLRRRANDAFIHAGNLLQDLYDTHKQPVTMGHISISGGHYRLPEEYALGDAHGYTHGVGALSFSSYHYLDEMARYLLLAPGQITGLRLTLQYVRRVADHLATGYNETLDHLLRPLSEARLPTEPLPDRVLLAEQDFGFTAELLDPRQRSLGVLTYQYASNTYCQRTVGAQTHDARNAVPFREKGRMSQYVFELHQGSLQHLRLTKNDAVGEPYSIRLEQRRHPLIGGTGHHEIVYEDAHASSRINPQDITTAFLTQVAGGTPAPEVTDKTAFLDGQVLTHRLYSAMYELIATHHHSAQRCPTVIVDLP
ncbi:Gfo/Idh/MocA family oxidoreductase [Streptomyces sp. NPDC088768]|uniref:Gfo/Idh/MocA family oxidoreductase n=1 Tax=Streptomyces sp. NPDC088768 TaxID=3365894 RepID=UPI00381F0D51